MEGGINLVISHQIKHLPTFTVPYCLGIIKATVMPNPPLAFFNTCRLDISFIHN